VADIRHGIKADLSGFSDQCIELLVVLGFDRKMISNPNNLTEYSAFRPTK
jgi:hypothetical protein